MYYRKTNWPKIRYYTKRNKELTFFVLLTEEGKKYFVKHMP